MRESLGLAWRVQAGSEAPAAARGRLPAVLNFYRERFDDAKRQIDRVLAFRREQNEKGSLDPNFGGDQLW